MNLNTYTEVYKWQVDNLLPFANQNEYMMMAWEGLDFAVQRKMLFLDLYICSNKDDKSLEEQVNSYFGNNNEVFYVWGWVEDEYRGVHSLSSAGGILKCIACNNLSFHAVMPSQICEFKQKSNTKGFTVDPNKFYIAFYASEADTIKAPLSFNHGGYLSPERGRVAINGACPPIPLRIFRLLPSIIRIPQPKMIIFILPAGHTRVIRIFLQCHKSKQKIIENAKDLSKNQNSRI